MCVTPNKKRQDETGSGRPKVLGQKEATLARAERRPLPTHVDLGEGGDGANFIKPSSTQKGIWGSQTLAHILLSVISPLLHTENLE